MSALSSRLPGFIQDIALGFGILLATASIIGYVWYWWHNRRDLHTDEPSFKVEMVDREMLWDDYERFFAMTLKNIGLIDLKGCCLVQIDEFSATPTATMPIPFVLRTDGQIRGNRKGRFNLSVDQTKTVPVLFRNPHRRSDWFLFDEHGKAHFVPAQDAHMIVGAYGGKRNVCVEVSIELGHEWSANFSLKEVEHGA